jgi:hypothetical protein
LVIKTLDPYPDPDSLKKAGSGYGFNESVSRTLEHITQEIGNGFCTM